MNALPKTNTESIATTTDVKDVLHSMLDNDDLDKQMEKILLVSGAMFTTSTNYLVSNSIVRHPKEFSKLAIGKNNRPAASFRQLGSVQSMNNNVLHAFKESSSQKLSRKAAKSITKAFEDSPSESDSEPSHPRKHNARVEKKKNTDKKAMTSKQAVTISSSEHEDTSSDEEQVTTTQSTRKNKRNPIQDLVDDLERGVQTPRKKSKK